MISARSAPATAVERYDAVAPCYDVLHGRWLRHAGGEAQAAFEGAATSLATPGARVLDAGCGTGEFARRLLSATSYSIELTMLDASTAMLARAHDLPARHVRGSLDELPFDDDAFDLVTCAWVLETTADEIASLRQLLRVTRPGGHLLVVFCAERSCVSFAASLLRRTVTWRKTGRFLESSRVHAALRAHGPHDIRVLPCAGPATAIMCRKAAG